MNPCRIKVSFFKINLADPTLLNGNVQIYSNINTYKHFEIHGYQNWPVGGAAGTGTGWLKVFSQWQHKASEVQQVPYHLTLDADIQRGVRMEAREGQRGNIRRMIFATGQGRILWNTTAWKNYILKWTSSKNLLVQCINEAMFWAYRYLTVLGTH